MKKTLCIGFSVLFLLLCAVPAAGMLILGPSDAVANEVPAAAPALVRGGAVNWSYPEELAAFVDGRFALRPACITADAALTAALLGESAADSVLLGRDGWLFYADTLADYRGERPMTERQLWCAARTLALAQEYAADRGAAFLFTVPPNKSSLYPEQMPGRFTRSAAPGNWQRLLPYLDAAGVAYCDLFPVLGAAAEPVYYAADSHWDGYGAALAHDALLSALGGSGDLAGETFVPTPHRGDLYEMLYPAGTAAEQGRALARPRTFSYVGAVRGPDDQTIRTESGGTMGSLLMFRDSFGNLLHQDLAESFSRATFSRAMPIRLDLLAGENTVIFELVERNLYDLLEKAPVMEGIRRETPEIAGEVDADLQWTATPDETLPGGCRYAGTVQCPEMDGDSPVYLLLDGAAYEASPAGAGDGAFTLYAPPAGQAAILIRCGGQWRQCRQTS